MKTVPLILEGEKKSSPVRKSSELFYYCMLSLVCVRVCVCVLYNNMCACVAYMHVLCGPMQRVVYECKRCEVVVLISLALLFITHTSMESYM